MSGTNVHVCGMSGSPITSAGHDQVSDQRLPAGTRPVTWTRPASCAAIKVDGQPGADAALAGVGSWARPSMNGRPLARPRMYTSSITTRRAPPPPASRAHR